MKKITLKTATATAVSNPKWQTSKQCEGLKEEADTLKAINLPDAVMTIPANHSLEYIDIRHGKEFFITSNGSGLWLWAWRNSEGDRTVNSVQTQLLTLDSKLKNIISVGEFMIVHTAGAMYYLKYTHNAYSQMEIADALPQISFSTVNETEHTAVMPALTFEEPVATWHSQLSAKNAEAVKERMEKALKQLEESAKAGGEWLQPIGIRYVLTDASGNVVYASAPNITGCGIQGNQAITSRAITGSNSYTGIEQANFSMKGFGIKMACIKGIAPEWKEHACTLHVLVAESRQPFTGGCHITLNSGRVGNYTLTAFLSAINAKSYAHYALSAPEWQEIATYPLEEIGTGKTHTIYMDNGRAKRKYDSNDIGERAYMTLSDYQPDTIASYNGMLLRAGGETRNMPAWNPVEMFQGTLKEMPCTVHLTQYTESIYGGEKRQTTSYNYPFTPTQISPVFAIPSPAIDYAILQITTSAGVYYKKYILSSYTNEGFSCAIDSTLAPVEITFDPNGEVITYPDIAQEYPAKDCKLRSSMPGNPFAMKHCSNTGFFDFNGIMPINNPVTSGLFSHLPLYVFADSGIYACTYEPVTTAARVPRQLSICAVSALPQAAASAPEGTYFIDGKTLCVLSAARCKPALTDFSAEALQYLHHCNSLVALTHDGDIDIYNSDLRRHRVPNIKARRILAAHSGAVIAVTQQNEVVEFSERNSRRATAVNLCSHPIEMEEPVKSAMWDICGTGLNLRLNIYGMAETVTGMESTLLVSYILQGASRVPVFTPVDAPFFSRISIEITGTATGNISISKILINPKP